MRRVSLTTLVVATAAVAAVLAAFARRVMPPAPARACRLETVASIAGPDDERVAALVPHAGALYAALARDVAGSTTLRIVRVDGRGAVAAVGAQQVSRTEALAPPVATPAGPAFAVADAHNGVAVVRLGRGGFERVAFPRGEPPLGRESLLPALALARGSGDGGAFSALASWPGLFGTRRLDARVVTESRPYTPARPDRFAHPALAVASDAVLAVHERQVHPFGGGAALRTEVEFVALPADPTARREARPVTLPPPAGTTSVLAPSVAARDAADGAMPGAAWVAARFAPRGVGVYAIERLAADDPGAVRAAPAVLLDERAAVGPTGVAALPGGCGALVAWLAGDAPEVRVRRVARDGVSLAERTALPLGELGDGERRLVLAAAGGRVSLAVSRAASAPATRAFVVETDPAPGCGVHIRALALPASLARGAARFVGLRGDAAGRIVVAGATDEGAAGARVAFHALDPTGGAATLRRAPLAGLPADVRDFVPVRGDGVVVASREPRGLRLDGVDPDGEAERIVIRGSRGEDQALAASAALARVWVADALDSSDTALGPAQTDVLYSLPDSLDDGRRTEDRVGLAVPARFARFAIEQVRAPGAAAPAFGTAWSGAASGEPARECLPGVYVALFDSSDAPIALSGDTPAWPGARVFPGDPARRSCDDALGDLAWAGARFALTASGPAMGPGARLLLGDIAGARPGVVEVALEDASDLGAVALTDATVLAAWLVRAPRGPARMRVQPFARDGTRRGAPVELEARVATGARDPQPLARLAPLGGDGRTFALAWPAARGTHVARVRCVAP